MPIKSKNPKDYENRLILYKALHKVGDDDLKNLIDHALREELTASEYNRVVAVFERTINRWFR